MSYFFAVVIIGIFAVCVIKKDELKNFLKEIADMDELSRKNSDEIKKLKKQIKNIISRVNKNG